MFRLPAVLSLSMLMISTASLWPQPMGLAQDAAVTSAGALLAGLQNLNSLSAGLVEQASSGRAPAQEFQLQARIYREQLRQTMLANADLAASQQLPQALLLDMVRMSALLHAAADCKSGLVIICPTDLLRQLRVQQAGVEASLKPFLVHGATRHD